MKPVMVWCCIAISSRVSPSTGSPSMSPIACPYIEFNVLMNKMLTLVCNPHLMTGCLCVGSQHSSGKPTSSGLAHGSNITFVAESVSLFNFFGSVEKRDANPANTGTGGLVKSVLISVNLWLKVLFATD